MHNGPGDHWRGPAGPPQATGATGQQDQRAPFGAFGPSTASSQPPSHVLPPPPYQHHSSQPPPSGHNLSIADLTQAAPSQHQYNTQPPPPSQGHGMSSLAQPPHPRHSPHHAGSIPIHQPVANKVQNSIHGPNGLLSTAGIGAVPPSGPATSAPGGVFGVSAAHEPQRSQFSQGPLGPPAQQQPGGQAFLAGPSPMQSAAQLPHGQQPILNDALSYLDQVKVQFSNEPDVYNRFLDIMKDFKSQAIDTPGVIGRVSTLFNGHPMLIQGFNTFLPPGYRIECEENSDAIRVTTPSGTSIRDLGQAVPGPFGLAPNRSINRPDPFTDRRRAWSPVPDESGPTAHRVEQQAVSLPTAVPPASNGAVRPPSPAPQPAAYPQAFGAADLKRGGPVEFNHAISYVNKIKNRFAQQPEIYKQFLEILQTYQRESKPIQDVYGQVTNLFHTAPDLLEDFKQFLPDTAAQAKSLAVARVAANEEMSNVRGEADYAASAASAPAQSSRAIPAQVGNANKRQKIASQPRQPQAADAVVVSPTLVPQLPEPLPPFPAFPSTQEELGFFDRAKKQIGNRANYTEFLKLINLFTQDLIDKHTLLDRALSFIGSNPDLVQWFKDFLQIQDQEDFIEAKSRVDLGRINLAHCRALGPSYRHLPKRDQNKTCKGRDGMCYQVLNDVWASHPTWASEDSGFVAHRKNQYEEALHRIEEERHDYDFHIESCLRTIQLMEPIVQQIATMTDLERQQFVLHPTLGGASEAIPKRIIMKIYGREVGARVISEMLAKPVSVLPIVLARLKQKLEEWKAVQREWEKVWRDQIHKQFWKSLDHQGINSKNLDKKNFQQKTLTTEIQAKWEEGKKLRDSGAAAPKHQLAYTFNDAGVITDASRLVLIFLDSERTTLSDTEAPKVREWFLDFVPRFFGLNKEEFEASVRVQDREDVDMQDGIDSDTPSTSKAAKHGRGGLLRRALDRRNGRDDSASASKESTPGPTTENEIEAEDEAVDSESEEPTSQPWIKVNTGNGDITQQQLALDETYPHTVYNLYANANIYCFFRLFEALYSRLLSIKANEASVVEAVSRYRQSGEAKKAAVDLHMIDRGPEVFFESLIADSDHHFYHEILKLCEEVLIGVKDQAMLEETLRRYYNKTGWQLYTVEKLVSAILRFLANILGGDAKDKSVDIANLFFKDREKLDTTRKQEIQYRKQVERYSKDGEVYRISYTPKTKVCTIRLFPSEDPTFDSDMLSDDQLWQYYVASYSMMDATEGVDQAALAKSYLKRNIAPQSVNPDDTYRNVYKDMKHFDDQSAIVARGTYKMYLTSLFGFERKHRPVARRYDRENRESNESFRGKFVMNTTWMKDQTQEDVERRKAKWDDGVKHGLMGFEETLRDGERDGVVDSIGEPRRSFTTSVACTSQAGGETVKDSHTNETAVSPASSQGQPLAESTERLRIPQAPNREETWSKSQRPRDEAMTGPRFEQTILETQPRPEAAIELIHKQPVRWVHGRSVACDGGGGPLGHPRIFINLDKPKINWCTYCGLPYANTHHKKHIEAQPSHSYPLQATNDPARAQLPQSLSLHGSIEGEGAALKG
ncbi:hypothetical protein DV737_g1313, partial [Chaetothyriales sp. CBS 132003]